MRNKILVALLVSMIGLAAPAEAQLRDGDAIVSSQTPVYDSGARNFLLNTLFNPAHFQMSHSVEMAVGSSGGQTNSLGMYTNTLAWNFNNKLAARADISLAYSPFSSGSITNPGSLSSKNGEVFLRNAEVTYMPTDNVRLHVAYQRSPYGAFMSPFGYYSNPYGYRAGY